jgi:Predicted metal-binding, possibly nucleic acid-binding protein
MSTISRKAQKSQSAADALTFNVTGLLGELAGSIRDIDVSSPLLDLGPDLHQNRDVVGRLRLTRTNRGLLVRGTLSTSIEQVCSRCLREIDYPVDLDIEEEALPTIDLTSGATIDTSSEPDALRLTDHHELMLEEAVRDAILLTEPIAPLCREDCPGLCVDCGQELGSGPHDHPDSDIDPRLEALREFQSPDE